MIFNNTPKKIAPELVQLEALSDLILAPDGRIYLSPSFEDAADWSCVYYDGNVCIHQNGNLYCLGALPEKCMSMPIVIGETSYHSIEDSGCLLHSKHPVLEDGTSVFAVFRYQNLLALYMADSTVSKALYFSLMEYTPEDEAFYTDIFQRLVRRHDPEAGEKVASWLKCHGANGGEV